MRIESRKGFTLVETAVCVGILGVLAGIALPVVSDAREEARQIACANRLVEITMGSLQFQEANEAMPPIHTSDGPVNQITDIFLSNDQNTGALAYILPFIGEQEIFDLMPEIATQPEVFLGSGTAPISNFIQLFQDPGMSAARTTQFSSVICPSNADLLDKPIDQLFYTTAQVVSEPNLIFIVTIAVADELEETQGRTSYLPSIGGFHTPFSSDPRALDLSLDDVAGPMRNRTTSIHTKDLGDGASNTICWSESLGYDLELDILFNGESVGASFALFSNALITGNRWNAGIDSKTGETFTILFGDSDNSYPWLIGSNHIDGNNVTFCDGSVRFLSDQTSRGVMAALGCGNDGFWSERTN